ncbi:AbrB/MazE/SpoVT family DNA-binding domain-containing protein [Candidatus Bathyarchaeota archaeon]|nr:AbrB/MazE/SpoVT family DNA-binding domain-containing protein [Candidatus Bathyarchaeota archaeon]
MGKKGVTVIPKKIREAVGISEGSRVKAQVLPYGVLLKPITEKPVDELANLPIPPREEVLSDKTVRELREKIDKEVRKGD